MESRAQEKTLPRTPRAEEEKPRGQGRRWRKWGSASFLIAFSLKMGSYVNYLHHQRENLSERKETHLQMQISKPLHRGKLQGAP